MKREPLFDKIRKETPEHIKSQVDSHFRMLDAMENGMINFKKDIVNQMNYNNSFDTAFELAFRSGKYMIFKTEDVIDKLKPF